MKDLKKLIESYGNFKVSNLGNGFTRIHAHNDKFTLGVICAEDKIRGSIKTKDGIDLYTAKYEDVSSELIETKLCELCMMYSRATAAFESVKDDTKSDLEKDDDKEVLLDDTDKDDELEGMTEVEPGQKVVVGMSGRIVASNEGEKETQIDDIKIENPVTEVKTDTIETAEDTGLKDEVKANEKTSDEERVEETSDDTDADDIETDDTTEETDEIEETEETVEDETAGSEVENEDVISGFDDASKKLVDIADSISDLVSKFDDSSPDKKLVATGLTSTMYTAACDLKSFVDEFLISSEVETSKEDSESEEVEVNDETVKESVSVPAKTNFIDIARGGINQARMALKDNSSDKKIKTILDVLSDIDSELVTQF